MCLPRKHSAQILLNLNAELPLNALMQWKNQLLSTAAAVPSARRLDSSNLPEPEPAVLQQRISQQQQSPSPGGPRHRSAGQAAQQRQQQQQHPLLKGHNTDPQAR
jgi:hypothetical protein